MTLIDTILILAGGDGDRFSPLRDKMQYRFNGVSLLRHIVGGVLSYGKQVIIVTAAHNQEAITKDLAGTAVSFVTQAQDKGGMADAVLAAKDKLQGSALILNANDVFDFTIIPELVDRTTEEQSSLGLVAKYIQDYFPLAYVQFAGDKAVSIVEKPGADKRPSNYGTLVVDYFPHVEEFVQALEHESATDDQFERAMAAMMKQTPATCVKYEGDWATIKYSWQVLSMQQYFFKKLGTKKVDPSATIHPTAVVEGNVAIGKNVKIGAFVKIAGPCFIGDNCIIGDHSLVRESTVNDRVLIGAGCEVARSYLSTGVMLHRNYVGDSVLGEQVLMGAGAVTANYRFDKKTIQTPVKGTMVDSGNTKFGLIAGTNAKIGVNATTYPGVKLAEGTVVLPGEMVTKDK